MASIGNPRTTQDGRASLFVDWSNIYIGRREAANRCGEDSFAVRVSAARLASLMAFGRPLAERTAVVNAATTSKDAQRRIAEGFRIIAAWPAADGFEQTNDALLRERMWEALETLERGVMVVASGDGNGWDLGDGFSRPLLAARRRGWAVEILSWRDSLHRRLASTVRELGGAVILLDDYYEQITFVEGGRVPRPLNLTHRPGSDPSDLAAA